MAQSGNNKQNIDDSDDDDALFSDDQKDLKQALKMQKKENGCIIPPSLEQTARFRMLVDTEMNERVLLNFIHDLSDHFENDPETSAFLQPYLRRCGDFYNDVVRGNKKDEALRAYTLAASLAGPKTRDRLDAERKIKTLLDVPDDFTSMAIFEAALPVLDTLLSDEQYSTDGVQHRALSDQIGRYETMLISSFYKLGEEAPDIMFAQIDYTLGYNYFLPATIHKEMAEWMIIGLDEMTSHARAEPNFKRIGQRFCDAPNRLKSPVRRNRIMACNPKSWDCDRLQTHFNTLAKVVTCLAEDDPQAEARYSFMAQQLMLRVQQQPSLSGRTADIQEKCLEHMGQQVSPVSSMVHGLTLLKGYQSGRNYGTVFRRFDTETQAIYAEQHRETLKDANHDRDPYGQTAVTVGLTQYALLALKSASDEQNVAIGIALMDNMFDVFSSQENPPPIEVRIDVLEYFNNNTSNDPRVLDWATQRIGLLDLALDSADELSRSEQVGLEHTGREVRQKHGAVFDLRLIELLN